MKQNRFSQTSKRLYLEMSREINFVKNYVYVLICERFHNICKCEYMYECMPIFSWILVTQGESILRFY